MPPPDFAGTLCAYPRRDGQAELTWLVGFIPRWFMNVPFWPPSFYVIKYMFCYYVFVVMENKLSLSLSLSLCLSLSTDSHPRDLPYPSTNRVE